MKRDFASILDRVDAGILITDKQGAVLFANAIFRKLSGCIRGPGVAKSEELKALLERLNPSAPRPANLKDFRDQERNHILAALDRTSGKIYGPDGAATLLGLPPTTLVSRLRKYGIPPRRRRAPRPVTETAAPQFAEDSEPPMLD